ncbi:MAG: 30S ribosome-binding factor RbfA [Nibricoccus sp.]
MSNRTLRVNELIQREMSAILRKRYQAEALSITIVSIEVTPDLLEAKVFVSVLGDASETEKKLRWLRKTSQEIRFELGRTIVLKHMPKFTYELDISTARGNRILGILDEIDAKEKAKAADSQAGDKKENA